MALDIRVISCNYFVKVYKNYQKMKYLSFIFIVLVYTL